MFALYSQQSMRRRRASLDNLAGGKDFSNFRRHAEVLKLKKAGKLQRLIHWFKNAITYEFDPKTMEQTGNIISYSEVYAIFFGAFIPRRGWIFSPLELLGILTISVGTSFLLGLYSCLNNPQAVLCVSLPQPNTSYLTLLTLCSFLLSIFINLTVQRWWTLRTFFSNLYGECLDCMMIYIHIMTRIAAHHQHLPDSGEIKNYCDKRLKKMTGLLLLLFNMACSSNGTDNHIDELYERGIISSADFKFFKSIDAICSDVCSSIIHCAYSVTSSKQISENDYNMGELSKISKTVSSMRTNTTNISLYINVQLPFPFIQVVSSVVLFFVVQLFIVSSSFVAFGLSTNNQSYVAIGLSTIALYNFVLFGFLRLYTILCDPCGDDATDFPLKTYAASLEVHILEMIRKADEMKDVMSLSSEDVYASDEEEEKDNLKKLKEKFGSELTF